MGAVAGTLLTEAAFIGWLGVTGTGIAAALFNFLAAGSSPHHCSAAPQGRPGKHQTDQIPICANYPSSLATGMRMLLAGFFSGAILLALEVVWFRFLILFLNAHSLAFAVMLSVVLAGIGLGGSPCVAMVSCGSSTATTYRSNCPAEWYSVSHYLCGFRLAGYAFHPCITTNGPTCFTCL